MRNLEEREGAWPVGGNRFESAAGIWVPLYEGKMVQAFDHRASRIVVNPDNLHRPAQPEPATLEQHCDPDWLPEPQYWVAEAECGWTSQSNWVLGFKEITAPTNVRTFIAALLPTVGFGNKVPILRPEYDQAASAIGGSAALGSGIHLGASVSHPQPVGNWRTTTADMRKYRREWLLAANLNATIFDFVARQKVQGQTLNLFIVEQLPVVPLEHYEAVRFGSKTAAEIVREAVLELTYTANDMAPFARDLGHVDETGAVRPPFRWERGSPASPPGQARRRVLPSLRRHRPGRCPLRVLHVPHRRTAGDRGLRRLSFPRPLPRLPQRPCRRPSRR